MLFLGYKIFQNVYGFLIQIKKFVQHEKGGTQTDALQNAKYAMPGVQNALIYMCSSTNTFKGKFLQGTIK